MFEDDTVGEPETGCESVLRHGTLTTAKIGYGIHSQLFNFDRIRHLRDCMEISQDASVQSTFGGCTKPAKVAAKGFA